MITKILIWPLIILGGILLLPLALIAWFYGALEDGYVKQYEIRK